MTTHYELEGPESAPVVTLSHSMATDLSMWDLQYRRAGFPQTLGTRD